jgi:acylphosphatase
MPDQQNSRSVHVRITGRVQGVGYRAWTIDEARRRGLSGWVRNLSDGDVEAVFSGDAATVDDMVAACRRGPFAARVDHVMIDAAEPVSGPFKVLYER